MTADTSILSLQTTTGTPDSTVADATTSPINPPIRTTDLLAHFPDNLYDMSAESHLARFIKALIGDAGVGGIKKAFSQARFEEAVLTTHFYDLDAFFSALFGFKRLTSEVPDINPYYDVATGEQWDVQRAKDSGYRARITEFASAVQQCPTPQGLAHVAGAVLGVECRIYESYVLVDENGGSNPGGNPIGLGVRTYGDIEQQYRFYGEMQRGTYSDLEGGIGTFGRTTTQNRQEFTVRPLREISFEETYHLIRILSRLKPSDALLTIDPQGVEVHTVTPIAGVAADSTYWEVTPKVAPAATVSYAYPVQANQPGVPIEQPRPAFAAYQGEAWSYNGDVASFLSYAEDTPGHISQTYDYDAVRESDKSMVRYTPDKALADQTELLLGRAVSDGILVTSPLGNRVVTP